MKYVSKNARAIFLAAGAATVICFGGAVRAEDASDGSEEHLFGNWGGVRTYLADSGIDVNSVLTTELMSNTSGGEKRGSPILGNWDLTAKVDTEKLGLPASDTLFAYVLGDFGRDPSTYVGDTQATSNIEAPNTVKLYEFYYDHKMFDDKASLLVGLHNYNGEFEVLSYASTLVNSSFGIGKDISQVGPSIFPTTSLAARLAYAPTDHAYIMTALYDGVPGDPNNYHGTKIKFESGDGVFWGSEVGVASTEEEGADKHYKAAMGFWYHTAKYTDYADRERDKNSGFYFIGETSLISEEDKNQGLGIFFQSGFTDETRNEVSRYLGAGLSYTGLFPSRDEDVFSVGIASSSFSNDFRAAEGGLAANETAYEFNYKAQVLPYLTVQPDLQLVRNPSGRKDLDNAVVLGLRVGVAM